MRLVSIFNDDSNEPFCQFTIRKAVDEAELRAMIKANYPDFKKVIIDKYPLVATLSRVKELLDKWGV